MADHKHMMPAGKMMVGKEHSEGMETNGSKKARSMKPKRKMKKREMRGKR